MPTSVRLENEMRGGNPQTGVANGGTSCPEWLRLYVRETRSTESFAPARGGNVVSVGQ